MARMVPRRYDKDTTTSGEARTFDALCDLGDEYVVLHSLALAEHVRQERGEADFVVIGPEGVLCLEVKGGRVAHREGRWTYRDSSGRNYSRTKSPWTQAADNAISVRTRLSRIAGVPDSLRRCVYASGVVFPDIEFNPKDVSDSSVVTEIVLDQRRNLREMAAFVGRCYEHWRSRRSDRDPLPLFLSAQDVGRAKDLLRGDFDFIPRLDMWVRDVDDRIETATNEEMVRYVEQAFYHDRVLLTGGAGTGKTVLSCEYARRRAGQGDRVLFLCFTRNLLAILRSQNRDPRVEYNSFHAHLLSSLAAAGVPLQEPGDDADREIRNRFYRNTLPKAFCELAKRPSGVTSYDCLVVDEGQDLIQPLYLQCMNLMLRGGLKAGRWHICYDQNQNIFNPYFAEGLQYLEAEATHWPCRLVVNCRNTYPIAAYNARATRTELPRIARIEGPRVEAIQFRDYPHELEVLRDILTTLIREQGIARREIFVLSLTGFAHSCFSGSPEALGPDLPVVDMTKLRPELLAHDSIKFCTTQGFKGLEAPVVILIDVQRLDRRDLLYTGFSRAKSVLYVLHNAALQPEQDAIMADYLASLRGEAPHLPLSRRLIRAREQKPPAQRQAQESAPATQGGTGRPAGHWRGVEPRGLSSIKEMLERKQERKTQK